jgi:tripartite-type tricarboxylate transporter receptor subunit TctC
VENRTDAGTTIAAQMVVQAPKDGYTLMYGGSANTVNATLSPSPAFDLVRDLQPVARLTAVPNILVVHPSLGVNSVAELIALAKSKPDGIFFASSGVGTSPHMSAELFNLMAGVKLSHVPYQGSSQGINDVLAGRVPVMFTPASTALPHIRSRALIALASTHSKRLALTPELPTMAEAGLPGFETGVWNGIMAPTGTPRPVIDKLSRALNEAVAADDVVKLLNAQGIGTVGGTPEEMAAYIRSEIDKWAKVLVAAKLLKQ